MNVLALILESKFPDKLPDRAFSFRFPAHLRVNGKTNTCTKLFRDHRSRKTSLLETKALQACLSENCIALNIAPVNQHDRETMCTQTTVLLG